MDPTTGRTFYVNHATQQTSWTPPLDSPLPVGWEEKRDEKGRTYFVHLETMKSTWQDPRVIAVDSPVVTTASSSTSYPSLTSNDTQTASPKFQLKLPAATSRSTSSNTTNWTCGKCTFENAISSSKCQMCDTLRPATLSRLGNSNDSQLANDEALAAQLQADLDRENGGSTTATSAKTTSPLPTKKSSNTSLFTNPFADLNSPTSSAVNGYQASEPFELLPNMVPDETSTKCLKCGSEFGKLVNRRHHCKCCGMLTCDKCSLKRTIVRLPTQKESLNEKEQRVCDWCFDHLVDGHAHCLYRYVVVASKEEHANRELAIRGIADIMEHLPTQMNSASDRAQAKRDLEILKFVGGVAKMCSFLSPGDPPSTQAEACRLVSAVAAASMVRDLESHLPKYQVASELSEGAALSIMALILQRPSSSPLNLSAQISVARVLYLLGDVHTVKTAAREAELIPPLCDALLSSDSQFQDWSCMSLGRLLKNDRASAEEVLEHNGIHNLCMLLSAENSMIQEHAAVSLQEAITSAGDSSLAVKLKKAMTGMSGGPSIVKMLKSSDTQVVSAGLRLLLVLSETEAQNVRQLGGIPTLIGIVSSAGGDGQWSFELCTLALQILKNVAAVGAMERATINQHGGLHACVSLMKTSTNSLCRKEATGLVEILSTDADGARGVVEASGGIAGLVDALKTQDDGGESSSAASSALSQILLQGPEAQAAMLEAGALEALLAAGSRGDLTTACRVVEATFSFVSDPTLLPKLAINISPSTLATRLIQIGGGSNKNVLPGHILEQLVLTLAVLAGARPMDYRMLTDVEAQELGVEDLPAIIKSTAPQTRSLIAANASPFLVALARESYPSQPGVALAVLRCILAVALETNNGDRIVANGGLQAALQAMADTMKAGDAPDTSSPQTQILLHSIALFARLCGGSRPRDAGRDLDSVRKGLYLLNNALDSHEPECMLNAVRALRECSFQSGTWSTIAETSLPRMVDMLLADKTGHGPGGRAPLSSNEVLRLLMDVSAITSNMAKLEVHCNALLDSGGVLALVSLLSEPEDDATASGVNALWALSESSKRCASTIARPETGAVTQLLHLAETNHSKVRALKLVRKLAESDASNAAQIAATPVALDSLLRLVRFEQSEDALAALASTCSASEAIWDRLLETKDINSTCLILEKSSGSARVQARACRAIATLCESNIGTCASDEVLRIALPIITRLLTPKDALGADKSESPAVDAAFAVASISEASWIQGTSDVVSPVMAELNALQGCLQLLMRERRLGRPKSASTAQALRGCRWLLKCRAMPSTSVTSSAGKHDGELSAPVAFWECAASVAFKVDEVFSALIMALDAHVQPSSSSAVLMTLSQQQGFDPLQAAEDVCFFISAVPAGLAVDSYLRVARPLSLAFEKSSQRRSFRVTCIRAMARSVREPALLQAMMGSVRVVATSLAQEKDISVQVETGSLLAELLKGAPMDRMLQDAVASSGAVVVLFSLLKGSLEKSQDDDQQAVQAVQDLLRALAIIAESGGAAVKKAILACDGDVVGDMYENVIANKTAFESWERESPRDFAFRILARVASLDRDSTFDGLKKCREACLVALSTKKCWKACELLRWLGSRRTFDVDEGGIVEELHFRHVVRVALLLAVQDKETPPTARVDVLEALSTFCEFVEGEEQEQMHCLDLDMFVAPHTVCAPATYALRLALVILEKFALRDAVNVEKMLAPLTKLIAGNEECAELAASVLISSGARDSKTRALLRSNDGFIKIVKTFVGAHARAFYTMRLLGLLGEDCPVPGSSAVVQQVQVGGGVAQGQKPAVGGAAIGIKREYEAPSLLSMNGTAKGISAPPPGPPPPLPPPPLKSAFPTFTATPSAQDRSSMELAMKLQQMESSYQTTSYARPPPPPASSVMAPSSQVWACPSCTLENQMSAPECIACGAPRPPPGGGSKPSPVMAPSSSGTVHVRCQSCMSELFAPSSSMKFKCGNCGTIGVVRDRKI